MTIIATDQQVTTRLNISQNVTAWKTASKRVFDSTVSISVYNNKGQHKVHQGHGCPPYLIHIVCNGDETAAGRNTKSKQVYFYKTLSTMTSWDRRIWQCTVSTIGGCRLEINGYVSCRLRTTNNLGRGFNMPVHIGRAEKSGSNTWARGGSILDTNKRHGKEEAILVWLSRKQAKSCLNWHRGNKIIDASNLQLVHVLSDTVRL